MHSTSEIRRLVAHVSPTLDELARRAAFETGRTISGFLRDAMTREIRAVEARFGRQLEPPMCGTRTKATR